jgi:hypothetical protein
VNDTVAAKQARIRLLVTLAFVLVAIVAGIVSGSSLIFVGLVAAGAVVNLAMRYGVRS